LAIPIGLLPFSAIALLNSTASLSLAANNMIVLCIVVPLVIAMLIYRWRADSRFDAVKALWPGSRIVEVQKGDSTTAALYRLGGPDAAHAVKATFVAEFDSEGARFYVGVRTVREFLRLSWREISAIDVVTVVVGNGRQARAIQLTVKRAGSTTLLPLVIKPERGFSTFSYSSPREIAEHFAALRLLRDSGGTPAPNSATETILGQNMATRSVHPLRRALRPGMTSASQRRTGLISMACGVVSLLAMLPFGILTWTGIWAAPAAVFIPFFVLGAALWLAGSTLLRYIPLKVSAELADGYTLSRLGDTSVDQLDPKTGFIIRPAGSSMLTPEAEKTELARVRDLA
jgi:hypothetical protein